MSSISAEHPTVSDKNGPAASGIEVIRGAGSQRPLFLVHDIHGQVAYAAALVRHIDIDMPAYGLLGAAPHEELPRTIEALAKRCIQLMRAQQPEAPYRVAGVSFGGVLAYEIAIQLIGDDQEVEFLGLIDAICPSLQRDPQPTNGMLSIEEEAGRYAQQHYSVQQLPIPVHVFSTQQDGGGWDAIVPRKRLSSIRVSGSPESMLTPPHVADLGQALGAAIRAATSGSSPQVTLLETTYRPHAGIQPGRPGHVPIFCIPGAGNSVTNFTSWAQAVGEEWPVHGLQPRGVTADLVPHSTVQAAAAQYLGAIEEAHPSGPLHLVGHSFGGWGVLELGHLLRARGRTVASLTVLDGDAPDTQGLPGGDYTAVEVLMELVDAMEMSAEQPLGIRAVDLAPLNDAARLRLLHQALVRVGLMPSRSKSSVLIGIVRTFGTALRTAYRPAAQYQHPVRLVTVRDIRRDADTDTRRREQLVRDWQRWAPRLSSWHAPGNHMTLLDHPHITAVADWWRSGLPSAGD